MSALEFQLIQPISCLLRCKTEVLLIYSLTSEISRAGPYGPWGIQHELRTTSVVCLIRRRLSLSMKMCAQRKAGRRQRAVCTLPMVPCSSLPVIYLARVLRKTRRLRRRLVCCRVLCSALSALCRG